MQKRRDSTFRFYEPARDREVVLELFKQQNLPVYLPLPEEDPSVAVAVVEEREGKVVRALVLKATIEAHYVNIGDDPYPLNRMTNIAEGAVMQLNVDLSRLKFPVFTDGRARVSKSMPEMIEFMKKRLSFEPETDAFVGLCKDLGK